MNLKLGSLAIILLVAVVSAWGQNYDVNRDGVVNFADLAPTISQAIDLTQCGTGDVNGDGLCNVIDVWLEVNAMIMKPSVALLGCVMVGTDENCSVELGVHTLSQQMLTLTFADGTTGSIIVNPGDALSYGVAHPGMAALMNASIAPLVPTNSGITVTVTPAFATLYVGQKK